MIRGICSASLFSMPTAVGTKLYILILAVFGIEWFQREKEHALQIDSLRFPVLRWLIYYVLLVMIFFYMGKEQSFVYFQF